MKLKPWMLAAAVLAALLFLARKPKADYEPMIQDQNLHFDP